MLSRKDIKAIGIAMWLLLSGCSVPVQTARSSQPPPIPHEVLAFYYGWYATPATSGSWRHWEDVDEAKHHIGNARDFPLGGPYDSHDPKIVERQVSAAEQAGLTGFIATWWGPGSFEDGGMPILLASAKRHHLRISAYYEDVAGRTPQARMNRAAQDLQYLFTHYGSDPAWLRVGGKPVVFIYSRAVGALSPDEWREVEDRVRAATPAGALFIGEAHTPDVAAAFDGVHFYNITENTKNLPVSAILHWTRQSLKQGSVGLAGPNKISCVTIIPGYDDSELRDRPPPRPITAREDGEMYRALWRRAIAANPNWILITSWNEWHEGSEIEPSLEYGSTALADTSRFAREFLSQGPATP